MWALQSHKGARLKQATRAGAAGFQSDQPHSARKTCAYFSFGGMFLYVNSAQSERAAEGNKFRDTTDVTVLTWPVLLRHQLIQTGANSVVRKGKKKNGTSVILLPLLGIKWSKLQMWKCHKTIIINPEMPTGKLILSHSKSLFIHLSRRT